MTKMQAWEEFAKDWVRNTGFVVVLCALVWLILALGWFPGMFTNPRFLMGLGAGFLIPVTHFVLCRFVIVSRGEK